MYATPLMNLENILFSEIGQSQENSVCFLSGMIPFIGKSTKTENKLVVALGWEGWEISRERGGWGVTPRGYRILWGGDDEKLIVMSIVNTIELYTLNE